MFKNDIKSLPFHQIAQQINQRKEALIEEKLEELHKKAEYIYKRKRASVLKEAGDVDYESGSDGIDENYAEIYGSVPTKEDVELSSDEIRKYTKDARDYVVRDFIAAFSLNKRHDWFMPALITYFSNWTPILVDGKYDGQATVKHNAKDSEFDQGAWYVAMTGRNELIKACGKPASELGNYNQLVPLILSGIKQGSNIPYSAWTNINSIVDEDLAQAMLSKPPVLEKDELLQLRHLAATNGEKQYNPKTSNNHNPTGNDDVDYLPKYARHMLLQTWCAHPENRSHHQVLNPYNWDVMPEPLIVPMVTKAVETKKVFKKVTTGGIPWDM